ncbi:MAG TPA: orotate phosphoribosyltransferase [Bacilli bacterium]
MSDLKVEIASRLLDIGAVVLRPEEPFTWSSGLKSPIYCDNRLTISYPDIREFIAEAFVSAIRANYPGAELIAGAATGGIPHAAWVAQKLQLPMIYVRDKAKGHGKQNRIEGVLKPGQKTVVIEDLVSTGGSSLKVAQAVNEAGGKALGVIAIFSYQLEAARKAFAAAGIPVQSLSDYATLLQAALQKGAVKERDLAALRAWREDPEHFGV